jgi:hypothetical protein
MLARMIDIVFCLERRPEQSVIWFTGHELVHG